MLWFLRLFPRFQLLEVENARLRASVDTKTFLLERFRESEEALTTERDGLKQRIDEMSSPKASSIRPRNWSDFRHILEQSND